MRNIAGYRLQNGNGNPRANEMKALARNNFQWISCGNATNNYLNVRALALRNELLIKVNMYTNVCSFR